MRQLVALGPACALALGAGLSLNALAQSTTSSTLQLYGLVDACIARAGLGTSHLKQINSGCLYGSRWGLRSTEDLGDGLRASIALESGITIDNGALAQGGRLFGRRALVSLGGPWGAVEIGRDYAPAFYLVQPVDPMALGIGTASSTIWTGAASTTAARNDNAVNLLSPSWAGWSLRLQATAGEQGSNGARRSAGFNLLYRRAGTFLGLSHAQVTNATATADDQATTMALRQEFGAFSLAAILQVGEWKGSRPAAAPASADSLFSRRYRSGLVGGSLNLGPLTTVNASFKRYDDRTQADFDATQWSVNLVHSLSKRSDLYLGWSSLDNQRASRYAVSDASTAYTGVAAGARSSLLAAGIKHTF